jgi:hypothetical protein
MENTSPSAENDDLEFRDDIDEVFGRANPNPDRIGCPPRETLVRLGRREQPIGDPGYEHLAKCSPCYREFRAIQQSRVNEIESSVRARAWWPAAVAAVLVLAAMGSWLLLSGRQPAGGSSGETGGAVPSGELRAEVDLRQYSTTRGDQTTGEPTPPSLRRGSLQMTMLLPVGSEPGPYEVQIVDADLRSKAAAAGQAEIRNYITTLDATIDLRALSPGQYQLAIRHEGDDWQLFPIRIE